MARQSEKYKMSERSNEVYSVRLGKEIEKGMGKLGIGEGMPLNRDMFRGLLEEMGYTGEDMRD